jgi:hypothetical protein
MSEAVDGLALRGATANDALAVAADAVAAVGVHDVVAGPAHNRVALAVGDSNDVVSDAGKDLVAPGAADEDVVATAAGEDVVAAESAEDVAAGSAAQHGRAGGAVLTVVAGGLAVCGV